MLCGIATSLPELVIFRAIQGACGAALIPLSQSSLLSVFPREKHWAPRLPSGASV